MAAHSVCKIPDCDKRVFGHGWCNMHYMRWRKHGDPLTLLKMKRGGPCAVIGCDAEAITRGYCSRHYQRLLKHGDPTVCLVSVADKGEPERYYREVVLAYDGDECLYWPFADNGAGYGLLHVDGRNVLVSRLVCEEVNGPPPTPEHEAAHNCGKGHFGCVNKRHLRWDTHAGNHADRVQHGTDARGEKCATAKLVTADVIEIRFLHGKASRREIARRFGVSPKHIGAIQRRKRWTWLK